MKDLTKWPRLLVVGESVTHEQANEILIRTNNWWYQHTNDHVWNVVVAQSAHLKTDDIGYLVVTREFRDEIGALNLQYLNNDWIGSSWIGGPKGWCDWSGTVGCSTWNIGKWPSHEEVTEDWKMIAEAFPYLNLRAQLVANEGEDTEPAGEWWIQRGEVVTIDGPTTFLTRSEDPDLLSLINGRFYGEHSERGCDVTRLKEALQQVRGNVSS